MKLGGLLSVPQAGASWPQPEQQHGRCARHVWGGRRRSHPDTHACTLPRRILRLAAPMSASNLAGYAVSLVAIAFVGRLGEDALSVGERARLLRRGANTRVRPGEQPRRAHAHARPVHKCWLRRCARLRPLLCGAHQPRCNSAARWPALCPPSRAGDQRVQRDRPGRPHRLCIGHGGVCRAGRTAAHQTRPRQLQQQPIRLLLAQQPRLRRSCWCHTASG